MKQFSTLFISIFLLTTFTNISLAQTSSTPESGTVVATVNISNAKILSNQGRSYKLSFDISNRIGAQPDVRYAVRLTTDKDLMVDEKVYEESLSLAENTSVNKIIDYTIPSSLSIGTYKLWIDSKNTSGLPLGIAYLGEVKITENLPNTVQIVTESCNLTKSGSTEQYLLNNGVFINLSDTLILKCEVQSTLSSDTTLLPNYITRSHTSFGDIVSSVLGSSEGIIIKKGSNDIIFTIPKVSKPQDYNLSFYLVSADKKIISNSISFNYTISGQSGTIQNVVFDKTYYKRGETANLQIYSTQTGASTITAAILDDKGNCSASSTKEISNFSIINLSIPITKDCTNPKADINLSSNNTILDSKNFQVDTVLGTSTSMFVLNKTTFTIVLIILFITIALTLFYGRKYSIFKIFVFTLLFYSMFTGRGEAAVPVITISASPNPVTYNGSVVVSGTVTNITSCTLTGGTLGTKIINTDGNFGFYSTFLKSNATFSISCTGSGGSASNYVIVPVTSLPITVDISASQASVLSGNSTNISWNSTGADSCTVTKNGVTWNTSVPSTSMMTYSVPFQPFGIAFDGVNMWTGNRYNYTVGKISPNGVATTISPPTYQGYYASPVDLAYDGTSMWAFNLYTTSIIKIASDGSSTYYSTTTPYYVLDIAFDGMNMWTVNSNNRSVLKISPDGIMTAYTGTGTGGSAEPAYAGSENEGIAYDGTNMWVTNNDNGNTVTKITPTGVMTNYSLGSDHNPEDIAFDGTNMWTVNMGSVASISKITLTGEVTTYTLSGYTFNSIAYDGTKMWVGEGYNNTVYTIDADGTVTSVIQGGYPGPSGIAFDGANMWLTYYGNSTVVKIDSHTLSNSQSSGALNSATTFTATCINNSGGSASKSVTVSTIDGININLNASSTSIFSGSSTTISWSSTNANYCEVTKNDSPWATTTTSLYNLQFGSAGSGNGQFNTPYGINIDTSGNIYVADYNNRRIQKFNSSGAYLLQFGSYGFNAGQFYLPSGVATDFLGNIYVVDYQSRIQKFNSSGLYLTQFNPPGYYLQGIALDSSGNVYVADAYYNRILKLSSSGTHLLTIGYNGSGNGQFRNPKGIAIDSSGNIYVADRGNNRIQKFNSSGAYLLQFGSAGSGPGQFNYPSDIAIDSGGNIYVADSNNNRIQKFNSSGAYLSQSGSVGTGNGQFSSPYGIIINSSGDTYITDSGNNRVQKFSTPVSSNTSGSMSSGSISTSTTFIATCVNSVSSASQSLNVDIIISHPLHRHPFPQPQH